jgi:hypothetical protein
MRRQDVAHEHPLLNQQQREQALDAIDLKFRCHASYPFLRFARTRPDLVFSRSLDVTTRTVAGDVFSTSAIIWLSSPATLSARAPSVTLVGERSHPDVMAFISTDRNRGWLPSGSLAPNLPAPPDRTSGSAASPSWLDRTGFHGQRCDEP